MPYAQTPAERKEILNSSLTRAPYFSDGVNACKIVQKAAFSISLCHFNIPYGPAGLGCGYNIAHRARWGSVPDTAAAALGIAALPARLGGRREKHSERVHCHSAVG